MRNSGSAPGRLRDGEQTSVAASGFRPGPRGSRRSLRSRAENRSSYLFLAPWLLGLWGITLIPLAASLYLSFTDYNILQTPNWIGTENYTRMLSDREFMTAVGVTARYVFISVPLQLVFALTLAIVLDKGLRGLAVYRAIYYLPSLLGGSVAIAIVWKQLFGGQGAVNRALAVFGVEGPDWLHNPNFALDTLMVLNVWTFGAPMIIFLAGLRQIPTELYEAARVDGAGWWRQLASVTIPLLTPVIFFNLVLQMIGAFQAFTPSYVVSGGGGGPVGSTLFYTLYLYQRGFGSFEMGYAAALAWVLVVAIAIMTAINFLAAKKWVFYGD